MKLRKRGRGRPKLDVTASARIGLRLLPDELARVERERLPDESLSSTVRRALAAWAPGPATTTLDGVVVTYLPARAVVVAPRDTASESLDASIGAWLAPHGLRLAGDVGSWWASDDGKEILRGVVALEP